VTRSADHASLAPGPHLPPPELLGVNADGTFGAETEQAIIAVQLKSRLAPDGVVGRVPWGALDD
jgi:peptidoglycan hydrolase-like protein with peptidoglycan-binding domain